MQVIVCFCCCFAAILHFYLRISNFCCTFVAAKVRITYPNYNIMKQKIFTLLAACIVCAGTISAEIIERVSIGDLMYNLDTEKAVAEVTYRTQDQTNYSTLSGAVVIPETVEYAESTFRVTSIGMGAFAFCENISTITLPVTITNIGMYAFHECHSLSSINLPEGLVSIGEAAFYQCGSLLPITIPSTLTTFGLHPFVDCVNMTKVTILSNSVVSAVQASDGICHG